MNVQNNSSAPLKTAEGAAPPSNLPSWEECQLRVSNSEFIAKRIAEGGYGAEHDSKLATELHRFIHEYDDADSYRSAWFRHRLEKLLHEVAAQAVEAQAPAAVAVPEGYALVPIEPTAGMCKAAADGWLDCGSKMVLNKAGAAYRSSVACFIKKGVQP